MRFLGRWLSQSVNLALSLFLAILAMQAPAFTREYVGALLQVAAEARRDIEQREASARQFYGIAATQDEELVRMLRAYEPSNAETLAQSLDRARNLQQAHDDITRSAPMFQPIAALRGAWDDPAGDKAAIWKLSLGTYNAQLDLSLAAALYGVAGLILGSLLGQLVLVLFRPRRSRLSARTRS